MVIEVWWNCPLHCWDASTLRRTVGSDGKDPPKIRLKKQEIWLIILCNGRNRKWCISATLLEKKLWNHMQWTHFWRILAIWTHCAQCCASHSMPLFFWHFRFCSAKTWYREIHGHFDSLLSCSYYRLNPILCFKIDFWHYIPTLASHNIEKTFQSQIASKYLKYPTEVLW